METDLTKLLNKVDKISENLVSCNGCVKCCGAGIVYTLPEEEERLKKINVPLINIDGIRYIKRKDDGSCFMLDKQYSRCSIYDDRPLCCHLFPLDIFNRYGINRLSWGVYDYCPTENVKPISQKEGQAELDLFTIEIMAHSIEKEMPKRVLEFLLKEDKVTSEIEILDDGHDRFQVLSPITIKV